SLCEPGAARRARRLGQDDARIAPHRLLSARPDAGRNGGGGYVDAARAAESRHIAHRPQPLLLSQVRCGPRAPVHGDARTGAVLAAAIRHETGEVAMSQPQGPTTLTERLAAVRLLAMDVDGVLTDGGILLSGEEGESKRFHVADGLGIQLA